MTKDKKKKIKKIKLRKSIDELDLPEQSKLKAAAIKYDLKKDRAPKIISIGKGSIAHRILELAEEHHIPIYEDQTMSELLSKLDVESEIPPHLYTIVAELLAFVYQLEKLKKQRRIGGKGAVKGKKGAKK